MPSSPVRSVLPWFLSMVLGVTATVVPARSQESRALAEFLERQGQDPVEYVLSKLADHRIVLLGEHHWLSHDVELVHRLIPHLPEADVRTLAVEMFPASMQAEIDRLVQAPDYDGAVPMKVLRTAEWPYREYGEIMRAVWQVNRRRAEAGQAGLRLLAIGPDLGEEARAALIARGLNYDSAMAEHVLKSAEDGRVLVYLGLHHAFTRYHQPETMLDGTVRAVMERTGNVLRRELGDRVFMIALHKPWSCGVGDDLSPCLPLDGAIDCAAVRAERPVAFDVASSPFAGILMQPDAYYALAGPMMRLVDFADGYVWTRPIGEYRSVEVLPLAAYAPDAEAIDWVMAHNPFGPPVESLAELEEIWGSETEQAERLVETRGWGPLAEKTAACSRRDP